MMNEENKHTLKGDSENSSMNNEILSAPQVNLIDMRLRQDILAKKWSKIVIVTCLLTLLLNITYLSLSIYAVAAQVQYNRQNCYLKWFPDTGVIYSCGQGVNEDTLFYICHLLVSAILLPMAIGFAITGSIPKVSRNHQITFSHLSISFLLSTFFAVLVLLIASLKMMWYSSLANGILFAICLIWTALLIPFLGKKILVTLRVIDIDKNITLKDHQDSHSEIAAI